MSSATQPESTLVARLMVAVVALSFLAAGSTLVGSAIDAAAHAPEQMPQVSENSSSWSASSAPRR